MERSFFGTNHAFLATILLFLAVLGCSTFSPVLASDLLVNSYELVSSKRIARTTWQYTYRANLSNSGKVTLRHVAARATSNVSTATLVDSSLSFPDVVPGTTVESTDTFTITVDRLYSLKEGDISWQVTGEIDDGRGVAKTIGPEGGAVEVQNPASPAFGVKVEIPPGALKANTLITLSPGDSIQDCALPLEVVTAGSCVNLGPSGIAFESPVAVRLAYDHVGASEEVVGVMSYNGATQEWENLEVVGRDLQADAVWVSANHFSPFVVYRIDELINPTPALENLKGVSLIDPVALYYHHVEGHGAGSGLDLDSMNSDLETIKSWGANVVRIPITPSDWLSEPSIYYQTIDTILDKAFEKGLAVIVDWHGFGEIHPDRSYTHPDLGSSWKGSPAGLFQVNNRPSFQHTLGFWRAIASLLHARDVQGRPTPQTFYEILNEPDMKGWGYEIAWGQWVDRATTIIREIRRIDPANRTALVAGVNWGYDLNGLTRKFVPLGNVAYVSHPYPGKESGYPTYDERWHHAFGRFTEDFRVFVSEWGFGPTDPAPYTGDATGYGQRIVDYLRTRRIGWTAWSFSTTWKPNLLESWANYQATEAYGAFVKDVLMRTPAAGNVLWLPNYNSNDMYAGNTVTRLSKATLQPILPRLSVGRAPMGIAVDDRYVWTTSSVDGTVSRIAQSNPTQDIETVAVGRWPDGIAVDRDYVWVANYLDSTITRITKSDLSTAPPIPVINHPAHLAVDHDNVWVANRDTYYISRIPKSDIHNPVHIQVPDKPTCVAVDETYVWTTLSNTGLVARIRKTDSRIDTFAANATPDLVAVDEAFVWVTNFFTDYVTRISKANPTMRQQIALNKPDDYPSGIAVDEDHVWVTHYNSDTISRIKKTDLTIDNGAHSGVGNRHYGHGDMTGYNYNRLFR